LRSTARSPALANVLIYATSNRRHLLPEYMSENLETKHVGDEVHPGESVEEKISLSERFGLWISFYPFSQDDYLAAVGVWLAHFGVAPARSARRRRGARTRGHPVRAAARLAPPVAWRGSSRRATPARRRSPRFRARVRRPNAATR